MLNKLLTKIESAGLVGRGGAAFPVAWKWQGVKEALKKSSGAYIIVNGAEGEPGVKKDGFILNKYPEEFLEGLFLAYNFLGKNKVKKIYIFLNKDYLKKYKPGLDKILTLKKYQAFQKKIEFFLKPISPSYIGGEETAILNIIEGKKIEPRLKPPFPSIKGLFGKPTLMNNIETFLDVARVSRDVYKGERFYSINGFVKNPGVYEFAADLAIEDILKRTNNYPSKEFFVQIGGQASGEILNSEQIFIPADSAASIMVYDKKLTDEKKLIHYWLKFYKQESCGNCSVCREGTYRLLEMFEGGDWDNDLFWEIVNSLAESSFCALGSSLPIPLYSYYKNIKKLKKS